MAPLYTRGGIPRAFNGSAGTAAYSEYLIPGGVANGILIENTGANLLLCAFNPEMIAAGESWSIAPGASTGLLPLEVGKLSVKASGAATTFRALALVRRG